MRSTFTQLHTFVLITAIILSSIPNPVQSETDLHTPLTGDNASPQEHPETDHSSKISPLALSGKIIDSIGRPAGNFRVQIVLDTGQIGDETYTDLDGNFYFATQQTKTYQLLVLTDDGRPLGWEGARVFDAPTSNELSSIRHEIRLRQQIGLGTSIAELNTLPHIESNIRSEQAISSTQEAQLMTSDFASISLQGAGHISGTVAAANGNQPLDDVNVRLYGASEDRFVQSDRTDSNGRYHLDQLEPGEYKLAFEPSSVGDSRDYLAEYYDEQSSLEDATVVAITVDETRVVNAQLTQGGTIEGVVTGEGTPLERVSVRAYNDEGRIVTSDWTDETGNYELQPLVPGQYRLKFDPSSSGSASQFLAEFYIDQVDLDSATPITISSDETVTAHADLILGGVIEGTVMGEGVPLERVTVRLYNAEGRSIESDRTDEAGSYQFQPLAPGEYRLLFEPSSFGPSNAFFSEYYDDQAELDSATPITILADETVTVNTELIRGGIIEGIVTADGAPLERVTVTLYDAEGQSIESDWTDETGSYQLKPLPPGEYRVKFRSLSTNPTDRFFPEYYDDQPDLESATPITILSDEIVTAHAELTRGGAVEGFVTGGGNPLDNVWVRVYDAEGEHVESDLTDETGHYQVQPLRPGEYRVFFAPSGGGSSSDFLSEYYDNRPTIDSARRITIEVDETVTVDADLTLGGKIRGQVTDEETGLPLPGVRVTIYRNNVRLNKSATTDASGVYTVTGLPTEGYRLKFDPLNSGPSAEFISEYYLDKETLAQADEIQVTAPNVVDNVNIQLKRGGRVTGQVRSATTKRNAGIPLPDIHVSLYDLSGRLAESTTTDLNGVYTITRLTDGHYWLYVNPAGNSSSSAYLPGHYLDPIAVRAPEIISGIDVDLALGGQIAGRITSASDGSPLASATVKLYDALESYFVQSIRTDSAGYYTSTGLYNGQYQLKFESPRVGISASHIDAFYGGSLNLVSSTPVAVSGTDLVRGINGMLNAKITQGGQITGTVSAVDTGLPLPSVLVVAYNDQEVDVQTTYTDSDGTYALIGLADGDYRIQFRPRKNTTYFKASPYQEAYYNGQSVLAMANSVRVVESTPVGNINASLHLGGRITGTVTAGNDGHPLSDIEVTLYNSAGKDIGSVHTDDTTGIYEFRGLASGLYRLRFKPHTHSSAQSRGYLPAYSGGQADLASASTIQINAPDAGRVDAVLDLGGQIQGQIVYAIDDTPAEDVDVNIYSATTGAYIGQAETNDQGGYLTQGLPTGSYWLEISRSADLVGPIEINAPQLVENINGSLPQEGTGRGVVAGRVLSQDSSRPLAGVRAELESCALDPSDRTNYLGIYYFDRLPADTYSLLLEPSNNSPAAPYQLIRSTIQLSSGEQQIGRFSMNLGARIAGKVTAEDTGLPLNDVSVALYDTEGGYIDSVGTDALGNYITVGVADGAYWLSFNPDSGGGYLTRYSGNQSKFEAAQVVIVTSPNIFPNNNAVLPLGGQIAGVVTAADSELPLDDVDVEVYDSTGNRISRTETDDQGRYMTRGLPSGTYRLFFETEYHNDSAYYVSAYYPNQFELASATEIHVTAPALKTNINISLQPGSQIAGLVRAEHNNQPLDDVSIYVYDSGGNHVASGNTNRGGFYRTNAVRAGIYRVRFVPENEECPPSTLYAEEYFDNQTNLESGNTIPADGSSTIQGIHAQLHIIDETATPTPTGNSTGPNVTAEPTSNPTGGGTTPMPTSTSPAPDPMETPVPPSESSNIYLPLAN
ncbi:MAG: carboxypeptidase regulatory-like domain-containing protein [Chloroflexota bacterium]